MPHHCDGIPDIFTNRVSHLGALKQLQRLESFKRVFCIFGRWTESSNGYHLCIFACERICENPGQKAVSKWRPLVISGAHNTETFFKCKDRGIDVCCIFAVLRSMMGGILITLTASTIHKC